MERQNHQTILDRIEAGRILWKETPNRLELLRLARAFPRTGQQTQAINIYRNHAIEPILTLGVAYQLYCGYEVTATIGPYDDSFGFGGVTPCIDGANVIWLDLSRYNFQSQEVAVSWIRERLAKLRSLTPSPILAIACSSPFNAPFPQDAITSHLPDTLFVEIDDQTTKSALPAPTSKEVENYASSLNTRLHTQVARQLFCKWLPTFSSPLKKAIILDLDNTLYQGVLGEDGRDGVKLSPAHAELHRQLIEYRKRGLFLALASKNQLDDVKAMFESRTDFPLKWAHFSAHAISWHPKSRSIETIAEQLRVGYDSLIFIDDNPSELFDVSRSLPQVSLVHAQEDAAHTGRALEFTPGLWRPRQTPEDSKRLADLAANDIRSKVAASASTPESYLAALETKVAHYINFVGHTERIADLSKKTNQFNAALRRFSETQINSFLKEANFSLVTATLDDKLSSSGIICAVIAHFSNATIFIDEICISCRALGRGLENTLIFGAVKAARFFSDCEKVFVRFEPGPRNEPAKSWIEGILNKPPTPGYNEISKDLIETFKFPESITYMLHETE
jgi:FkbH-like protein